MLLLDSQTFAQGFASREMLARETCWEWLKLTDVLIVLTAESRPDKNGRKRVVKEILTGSLPHFSRRHRPLSQVARVLFSLYSF